FMGFRENPQFPRRLSPPGYQGLSPWLVRRPPRVQVCTIAHDGSLTMLTTQPVPYRDGETSLNGFLAWDSAHDDRRPGILVVHGGAGLDDHAKGRAQRFAELGFLVFACDMYGDGVAGNRQRIVEYLTEVRREPTGLRRR